MKKQWFRTTDLVDEKFIEEADPAKGAMPLHKKRLITTIVASAACLALTLTGLWLFRPDKPAVPIDKYPGDQSMEQGSDNDYSALIEKLTYLKENSDSQLRDDVLVDSVTPDVMLPTGAPDAVPPGATPDGSQPENSYEEITDNQVEGITEADRIKRSNTHIFYLDGATLKIFSIAGMESQQVGSILLAETYQNYYYYYNRWEFYLSADCKTVTVLTRYRSADDQLCVGVISVDVSDPTDPTVKNKLEITGNYLSSRMTDGKLLLMTEYVLITSQMDFEKEETFLPQINGKSIPCDCIILPEEVDSARYTVVLKLDENTLAIEGQSAALSYTDDVYVSHNYIFLTHLFEAKPEDKDLPTIYMTEITALSYKDTFEKEGTVSVCGLVKDQWSMDEYEGILRVVTTTQNFVYGEYPTGGKYVMPGSGASNASLYCVDLKEFKVVASVENFAPDGENVKSVRFNKNTAYVCTAIQVTDPVYFFDLSDLNNITYKETGNISGFSTSLINLGDGYLLGIGQEDWYTFKAEVYEETETGVASVCKYLLNNVHYSEEYKSYYIDRENKFVGLGMYDRDEDGSLYLLLQFDGYNLVEMVKTPLPGNNDLKRAVCIDDYLYLFGTNDFCVVDMKTAEKNYNFWKIQTIYDVAKVDNIPCDTAMELFWEDRENSYYFPCIKSQYIKVVYQDGTYEDIVTALSNGHATISDLDRFGIDYYVKSK